MAVGHEGDLESGACCKLPWRCWPSHGCHPFTEWKFLFRIRGSVIPRAMLFAVPSAALSVAFHYYFAHVGVVSENSAQANSVWASVTFVLGVLLAFRSNQAYSRYWEGATLLMRVRGEWLNASSSLIAFCNPSPTMTTEVAKFQHKLVRLMSLLYCAALQQVSLVRDGTMEVIDMTGFDEASLFFLVQSEERCDVLLQWIRRLVVQSMSSGVIPVPPPILTRVFQELSRGLVDAKDVQKIAEFPFPFPYTQLILAMLVGETILTPMVASSMIDNPVWSAAVTFCSVLALWSLNHVASELEQPFGEGVNDLPIVDMMKEMNLRLRCLLNESVKTPPEFFGSLEMTEPVTMSCAECGFYSTKKDVEGFCRTMSVESFREPIEYPAFPWMTAESSVYSAHSSPGGPGPMRSPTERRIVRWADAA